jgi:uncharacterized cofD-like protein
LSSKRIVVLGGGTGSFTLLQSLKTLSSKITAIVNMCDDGGSTGVLRDELGVLPPGDARQCLVALSESPEIRDLFDYRFGDGRLEGQSLGNIILSGLELQHGGFEKAVEVASRILRIRGKVLPVVLGNHSLVMKDGAHEVVGQRAIELYPITSANVRVRLEPVSTLNPKADAAIRRADLVVIAPGSFYTSLLPIFSTNGIAEALAETKAQVVFVANLVNKLHHTPNWHAVDYVHAAEEYIGKDVIDIILYNNQPLSTKLLAMYAAEGEFPVAINRSRFTEVEAEAVGAPLVSSTITPQNPADKAIQRTYIRHDPWKVKTEIEKVLGLGEAL